MSAPTGNDISYAEALEQAAWLNTNQIGNGVTSPSPYDEWQKNEQYKRPQDTTTVPPQTQGGWNVDLASGSTGVSCYLVKDKRRNSVEATGNEQRAINELNAEHASKS